MLDDWCSLHSPDHPLVAMKNHIPTKPPITLNIHGISVSQCTVSAIAAIALEQRNIASLARQDSGSCISGSNGLKSLRDQIILRDLSKDVRAAELLRENIILETKNRLLSLTSLCDTLRTKCLTDNRTCLKIPELLLLLKSELFLTRKELTLRVEILEKIVPEFITVVAADNIVPVCTVRLNLHTSYSVVRQKVAEHVLSESQTM